MLVVRDGDDDGVDVRPCKEVLVVLIDVHLYFLLPLSGIEVGDPVDETVAFNVIHVAAGDYAHILHGEEVVEEHKDLLAEADESEGDLVVGGLFGFCGGLQGSCRRPGEGGGQQDAGRSDG